MWGGAFHHSSEECFGIHLGAPQSANLGDGNGFVNQTIELRQDFGSAGLGTCLETLVGGNHFRWVQLILCAGCFLGPSLCQFISQIQLHPTRVYRQNGSLEDTGALFLASVYTSRDSMRFAAHSLIHACILRVSKEEDLSEGHTIVPDGYDIGRSVRFFDRQTAGSRE